MRDYLREHGISMEKVNVISLGAHSRRTRLLYEKAFGPSTRIGIIAVPHRDFDPARWWRTSQGVRVIIGEVIAYGYARCVFHPAEPGAPALRDLRSSHGRGPGIAVRGGAIEGDV